MLMGLSSLGVSVMQRVTQRICASWFVMRDVTEFGFAGNDPVVSYNHCCNIQVVI